ncbi:hypothetical protein HYU21_00215 [Candidatus Woesearchaeota archaeon]|nr:hypothetical protein [Candidatus Woesearchaeota archaeon]
MRCLIVQAEEIKNKLKEILGEQLEFEGHFSIVIDIMSEAMQQNLLLWANKCALRELDHDPSPADHN